MSEIEEQIAIAPGKVEPNVIPIECTHAQKVLKLPLPVRALRNLQLETKSIQREFFESIYKIEIEFQKKHELIYKKRFDIINGYYVPTEADADLNVDIQFDENDNINNPIDRPDEATSASSGVPRFWLNILSSTLFDINENDAPILELLTDVRARNKSISDLGFILEFHFSPNDYFENSILTKEYFYTCSLGNEMIHEGPEIHKSVGCEIKWKKGKAPSERSFFDYFRTTDSENITENNGMWNDFEMGYFIKERVIPRAVLFFSSTINSENISSIGSDQTDSSEQENVEENISNSSEVKH